MSDRGSRYIGSDRHVELWKAINSIRESRTTEQKMEDVVRVEGALSRFMDAEIARLQRERDEAKMVLVWALKHKVIGYADRISYAKVPKVWSVRREVDHDGTDADIYRALRDAMGGAIGGPEE